MSNTILSANNLTISYAENADPAVKQLNFEINQGEFVLIVGPSGSGLSTLAKYIAGIIPEFLDARIEGSCRLGNVSYSDMSIQDITRYIGLVFQNPREQVFCQKVEDEVSFAVENLNLSSEDVISRVDSTMELLDVEQFRKRDAFSLSGGQLQRVVVSSVVARGTKVIVLDEPTADLDPVSTNEVLNTFYKLKEQEGTTILLLEHSIGEIISSMDRLIVLNKSGEIIFNSSCPADLIKDHYRELQELGIRIPEQFLFAKELTDNHIEIQTFPDIEVLAEAYVDFLEDRKIEGVLQCRESEPRTKEIELETRNLEFAYPGHELTLKGIDLQIPKGSLAVILGQNGSGKSTFLKLLSRLLEYSHGSIFLSGEDIREIKKEQYLSHVGLVFQNPDTQLFCNTVYDEVAFGLRQLGEKEDVIKEKVANILRLLNLDGTEEVHPFSLSRGTRLRLALATVLVTEPEIILFDEPTTGQDTKTLNVLVQLLKRLETEKNRTIIMVTHDMNLAAEAADYVYVFENGRIAMRGDAYKLFSENVSVLENSHIIPPFIYRLADRISKKMNNEYETVYAWLRQILEKYYEN